MNKKYLHFFIFLFLGPKAFAQVSPSLNAAEIRLGLEKLNIVGSVLYFAAHPDDENTRLITWLAKDQHYRTAYLSLTRGDGGQNLIGTEQAENLGLMRTQELLAARKLDGGEQFFSRANDFGFSKTADETFSFWDKEKILADAVWVIRKFRPDVIITRFPPDERAGHGHHQASAMIAAEAFKAAGDPKRFPEQLAFVQPWQARRLLWNTSSFFGNNNTASSRQFHILVSDYNPLLGKSYGEIASESRSSHRTQGFGSAKYRGETTEYFQTQDGVAPTETLMDGIDISWKRVVGGQKIQVLISQLIAQYEITHPEKSIAGLIATLNEVEKLEDEYWREQKSKEIKDLILACAGIWFESYAPAAKYAIGEKIPVKTQLIVRNKGVQVKVLDVFSAQQEDGMIAQSITPKLNQMSEWPSTYKAEKLTQPYWLGERHGQGSFEVNDLQAIGLPENPDPPAMFIRLSVNSKDLLYKRPVVYKYAHPARGEVYEPLTITPALTININQRALVFNGDNPKQAEVVVTSYKQALKAQIKPLLPQGWRSEPATMELAFKDRDEEVNCKFMLYPAAQPSQNDSIGFEFTSDGKTEMARSITSIHYEHIPSITWFPESKSRLTKIETGISAQKVGYLTGAGDLVPASLRELGLQVDELNESTVLNGDLSGYDAIVTGVRLYNVNDRMRYLQPHLLEYVKQGGTLVEQYNVNGSLTLPDIGPYPFTISRNRVTEEDATVVLAVPDSPVLNFPNKISPADFEGWIQERGLYFVENADSHYLQPLEMHDKGEPEQNGSLIVTPYGKGKYVYTSLAFFRELPAGVPGAYRLFINLLAKEKINN